MWRTSVISGRCLLFFFFFQAEDGIRDAQESRGLGDVYKRQAKAWSALKTLARIAPVHWPFKQRESARLAANGRSLNENSTVSFGNKLRIRSLRAGNVGAGNRNAASPLPEPTPFPIASVPSTVYGPRTVSSTAIENVPTVGTGDHASCIWPRFDDASHVSTRR